MYIRWKLAKPKVEPVKGRQGQSYRLVEYHVQLVVAKAKIASSNKVPRNEIDSLIILARLITATLPGLIFKPTSILIVGDTKCTIQSITAESKILKLEMSIFELQLLQWSLMEEFGGLVKRAPVLKLLPACSATLI